MRLFLKAVAACAVMAAAPASAATFSGEPPIDDVTLGAVVGKAAPTTRLSAFVTEQGAVQSQFTGENLRITFENWFADGNVQRLVNETIR